MSQQLLNLTSQRAVPMNSSELLDVTNVLQNLVAVTNAGIQVKTTIKRNVSALCVNFQESFGLVDI